MKYFNRIFVLAFFLLAPLRIVWCLDDDFKHPERWGDPMHNPYVSLALGAIFLVAVVVLGFLVWSEYRRVQGESDAAGRRNPARRPGRMSVQARGDI